MPDKYRNPKQKRKAPCTGCAKRRAALVAARDKTVNFIKRKAKW